MSLSIGLGSPQLVGWGGVGLVGVGWALGGCLQPLRAARVAAQARTSVAGALNGTQSLRGAACWRGWAPRRLEKPRQTMHWQSGRAGLRLASCRGLSVRPDINAKVGLSADWQGQSAPKVVGPARLVGIRVPGAAC